MTPRTSSTPGRLPVFFTDRMVASPPGISPSAAKPAQVVESWLRAGLPIDVIPPTPATLEELCRVHSPRFVDDILSRRIPNGFLEQSPEVAESLPWTVGSMLSAARAALDSGGAAAAPCSGFHHAGYERVGAYCTFNGLMVTAAALQAEGLVRRVGIIDCDMHFGDGTEEIIDRIRARDWVRHFTAGHRFADPSMAGLFFKRLPRVIEAMADCDVVLYQAGADPHVKDPLGGFLTTKELRRRDAMVFEGLRRLGVPVAWNLAGGYQVELDGTIPVLLEIHMNTAVACIEASAGVPARVG